MEYQASRTDINQPDIVKALRWNGMDVECLHEAGKGLPDLLCAYLWLNFLVEVKNGKKSPSARELTPSQERFHKRWSGLRFVVKNIEEAISLSRSIKEFVHKITQAKIEMEMPVIEDMYFPIKQFGARPVLGVFA